MSPLVPAAVALHLGRLHGSELLILLIVALGPFVVLVVVVLVLRRRDEARSAREVEPPSDLS